MSNINYYYAKLNQNDICFGFDILGKKLKEEELGSHQIPLAEDNRTYLWKKWDRVTKSFGQESFEPDTDFELLEEIEGLKAEVAVQKQGNITMSNEVGTLNQNITLLEGTIAELTTVISIALGGM